MLCGLDTLNRAAAFEEAAAPRYSCKHFFIHDYMEPVIPCYAVFITKGRRRNAFLLFLFSPSMTSANSGVCGVNQVSEMI